MMTRLFERLHSLFSHRHPSRSSRFRPRVEALEDRVTPSTTWIVDNGQAGYSESSAPPPPTGPTNITNVANYEVAPHMVSDAAGNLHLVYQGGPSGSWHAFYKFKPAAGNWQAPVDLGGSNIAKPRIAIDSSGALHVVWFDQNEVQYRSRSATGAWSATQRLSAADGKRSLEAAIATDNQGRIHVVWHDEATGNWDVIHRRFEAGALQPQERVSTRGDDDVFPRVATGPDGTVHIVWHNSANNEVTHRQRSVTGAWSAITRLDTSAERSFNPDIAVDAANTLHVSWHDNKGGDWDAAYVKRVNGVWTAPHYFLNAGVTDGFTSLAVGPNNAVSLIWMDYNNLYLVRNSGTGWTGARRVIQNLGAKDNIVAIDPAANRVHVVAQCKKTGVTAQDSWDLFWYAESAGGGAGSTWRSLNGVGYGDNLRFAPAGTGTSTATWQLTSLAAGTYTVQATWNAAATHASNAPFQIYDGTTLLRTVVVDQRPAPSGTRVGGVAFQSLATLTIGSGTLRVVLSDGANGEVVADAVRVIGPATNITNLPDYEVAPHMVTDAAGNVHLVYQGGPSGGWHAFYKFKPAAGNWQAPVDLGGVNIQKPRIAIDPSGALHVVWFDQNEVQYRSRSATGAWSATQRLSAADGKRSLEAAIAADGQGRVHVVWHDEATGNWDVVHRRFEAGAWQPQERVSTRGDDDVFPRVATGPNGAVHIVWHNSATNEVYHRERSSTGAWSAIARLDVSPERSFNPDLVVDASNVVHVSWHDNKGGDWDIAYVKRVAGVWTAPHYFLNAGVTDAFSALAVGPDGVVSIIWTDYDNIYLVRSQGTGWTAPRKVISSLGAKDNAIAIDPISGGTIIVAQVKKTGVTNQGSWDLFWYCE